MVVKKIGGRERKEKGKNQPKKIIRDNNLGIFLGGGKEISFSRTTANGPRNPTPTIANSQLPPLALSTIRKAQGMFESLVVGTRGLCWNR